MTDSLNTPFMRALAAGIQANVPTLLWGGPGEIKTAFIEHASATWGRTCKTIVGSTREAPDFLGVMVENAGEITYSTFGWIRELNEAKAGLSFLDEFNTASPSTMKGMLRYVQERYLGEVKLKDSVSIVAAANPVDEAVDAYDLPAAMANRMMHLDWEFPEEFWLENIATNFENVTYPRLETLLTADPASRRAAVAGAVTSYHKHIKGRLKPGVPKTGNQVDPVKAGKAWASPRAWSNVITVLSQLEARDEDAALLVVKGLVGQDQATNFFVWLRAADLHNPSEVLENPGMVDWANERPDRLYALVHSVTALGLSNPEKNFEKAALVLTACALHYKADVALPSASKLMNNMPPKFTMPKVFQEAFLPIFAKTINTVSVA